MACQLVMTDAQSSLDRPVDIDDASIPVKDEDGFGGDVENLVQIPLPWRFFHSRAFALKNLKIFYPITTASEGFSPNQPLEITNPLKTSSAPAGQPTGSLGSSIGVQRRGKGQLHPDKVVPEIAKHGGKILRTSLPKDVETRLQSEFRFHP
ncbi:MAG: hypothetical protein ACYC1U_01650 [Candidatus Aquicultorales bacterium]